MKIQQKRVNYFVPATFSLLAILTLFAFNPIVISNTHAADPVLGDTELTLSTSSLNMVMSNITAEGVFATSTPANISVTTTNYTGYKLTIAADDPTSENAGKLVNGRYTVDSISAPSTAANFTNNTWGLLPSMVNSTTNDLYQPAPASEELVINETSAANTTTDTYTLAFGAKMDLDTPAGTYTNTFVISATPNPVMYGISFVASTEPGITNMPETEYGSSLLNGATITDQIPERDGYDFCAWCSGEVTTAVGVDSCDSDSYLPGDSIDLLALPSPFITLKTMWTPSTYTISYDLDGGTAIDNPIEYTVLTEDITLNKPTKSGFKFMGWTGTGLTEPTKVVTIPAGSTGNRSYTATWAVQTCEFTSETIGYTGDMQPWTVPCDGEYELEVWGGQGGGASCWADIVPGAGGKGGYAVGTKSLTKDTILYLGVGGGSGNQFNGGGGGSVRYGDHGGHGGGGTHIGTQNAQIASTTATNLLIVAGGGGGGVCYNHAGGSGGGTNGGQGSGGSYNDNNGRGGYGGTQTAGGARQSATSAAGWKYSNAGSYGRGGDGVTEGNSFGAGGGGGGYYGGASGVANGFQAAGAGGGGSGYIGGVENGSMENGVRTGNGQITITLIEED